jgi:hypothetical protein
MKTTTSRSGHSMSNVIDLEQYRQSKAWEEAAIKAADLEPHGDQPDPIATSIAIARQVIARSGSLYAAAALEWAGHDFQRLLDLCMTKDYRLPEPVPPPPNEGAR